MSRPFQFLRCKSSGYDALLFNMQLQTLQRIKESPSSKPSSSTYTATRKKPVCYIGTVNAGIQMPERCQFYTGGCGMDLLKRKWKMESIHLTGCHIPEDLCVQQHCCENHILHISISSFSDITHSSLAASSPFLKNFPFCFSYTQSTLHNQLASWMLSEA